MNMTLSILLKAHGPKKKTNLSHQLEVSVVGF